jgi:hypothetical protein
MNGTNRDYYIVDFVASRKYFHTHPLIIGISQFLTKNGHTPSILLPCIADKIEPEFISGSVNYVLDAGYSSRSSRPLRHMTRKILTIVFGSKHSGRRVKSYLRQRYIKSGLKYFQNIKNNHSKHIIFTTLEPLSLELALELSVSSKMDNYYFYFRIIGAESRGILSSNSELNLLLNLIKHYPKKIRIGVETNGYKSHLVDLGFPPSCIFWSPWPCLENFDKQKLKNRRLKIGFLGCAKQRKGFDNIPIILNHLKTEGFDFDIQIQEANFPWAEYEKTKNDIKLIMDDDFEFLSSNLELVELQDSITKCDLLILPYDSNSYSINASGVLYHACDSSVPVVTAKGVGFAAEIENFSLGLTYDNLDEIAEIVKNIQLMKYDFEYYNFERNKANDDFLFINGII